MTAPLDLAGNTFGRLLVVRRASSNRHGQALWKCRCVCGGEAITTSAKLVRGHTKSCGCIKDERMRSMRPKPKIKPPCAAPGCARLARTSGTKYCGKHSARFLRYGRITLIRRENGTGWMAKRYLQVSINGRRTYEHIVVAERALGRRLPKGAIVHHVNLDTHDNRPSNLVICPSEAYHRLLHKRMRDAWVGT